MDALSASIFFVSHVASILDLSGIIFGIVGIGESVLGSLSNPQAFGLGLDAVELVYHKGRDEVVAIAMDEEHGVRAVLDFVKGGGFTEAPTVFEFAEQGGGVEQGKCREPELLTQLIAKFIPHAGISTVFDETDAFQPRRHGFACNIHGGGCPHRNTMYDDGVHTPLVVGNLHPLKDIKTFVPPHSDSITLTESMSMEVGHEDMTTLLLMIKTTNIEEVDGTIAPTVNHDGSGMAAAVEGIVGMVALACGHDDEGVAQTVPSLETVEPGGYFRMKAAKLTEAEGCVAACRVGCQRIVEHIETGTDSCYSKDADDGDWNGEDEFLHSVLTFSGRRYFFFMIRICF